MVGDAENAYSVGLLTLVTITPPTLTRRLTVAFTYSSHPGPVDLLCEISPAVRCSRIEILTSPFPQLLTHDCGLSRIWLQFQGTS